jgi:hypothetical protein
VGSRAKDAVAAKALLEYLSSRSAGAVYTGLRMQPGH